MSINTGRSSVAFAAAAVMPTRSAGCHVLVGTWQPRAWTAWNRRSGLRRATRRQHDLAQRHALRAA